MADVLQVVAVLLTALAMCPALAHALEYPGKRRLRLDLYRAVQRIYYPGFTMAGVAEVLAPIATAILLFLTPPGELRFSLFVATLAALVGMQVVYWMITHPVNKYWLEGASVGQLGGDFFESDPLRRSRSNASAQQPDWSALRERWEHSHLVRAALSFTALLALVVALKV